MASSGPAGCEELSDGQTSSSKLVPRRPAAKHPCVHEAGQICSNRLFLLLDSLTPYWVILHSHGHCWWAQGELAYRLASMLWRTLPHPRHNCIGVRI
jgi:hypothetical protein